MNEPAILDAPADGYLAERQLVEERLGSEAWQRIDAIEDVLGKLPQVKMPLNHIFTPGLYTREIMIPRGTIATTRIHLTEHPFVISLGMASIWTGDDGWSTVGAPFTGVTKAGTRRVIYAHTDVIWTTFHVSNETDPDKIGLQITYTGGKFAELGAAAA
jgi:hypothetical protein